MEHGGQPERDGEVMSQVQGDRDLLCDNLSPIQAQTGNLNQTSTLGQNLFQKAPIRNTGRSREEEEEEEGGGAEGSRDDEEEDLDELMEEEEDVSEASSSIVCCRSPDTPMTDSSYSETASLLEAPCPFSPGTSPEPTSPIIPTAAPETPRPQSEPLTSDAEWFSSGAGSVPVGPSLASPTSGCRPADSTGPTEHVTSSTPSAAAGSPSTGPGSAPSWAGPADAPGPVCEAGPDLLKRLEELAQGADDAQLPQNLHQVAEAFVLGENYQWALWCIQLERLYHQRVLDNLNVLQEHWESQSKPSSPELAAQHLDRLKHICQTHSRPRAGDAAGVSVDVLRPAAGGGGEPSPCGAGVQVDGRMEPRDEDSSPSESSLPVSPPCEIADVVQSPDTAEMKREAPERESAGREGFHGSQPTDGGGGGAGGALGCTIPVLGDEPRPSTSAALEQAEPAEQEGGGGDPRLTEEGGEETTGNALKMDVEGEDEEEGKLRPVESVVSGAEEEQRLHPGAEESQESSESLPPDDPNQEEDEYELEEADFIREASLLDDLAKLITVEEVSPASGLVSILKRPRHKDTVSAPESRSSKASTKRRVRFKFPDDGYEHDVGGGDSCLLLFLLCLVTVVISLGGTALYCALGDRHSSVCQDFSRNADFYMSQIQRGISQLQHWFGPGS